MGLLVVFGRTSLILGGDVEKAGWADVLAEFGSARLSGVAIKVSHHGSTNGYCDGLWKVFSRDGPPLAVVTSHSRHGLPQRQALEHIREFADKIVTPFVPAITPGQVPQNQLSTLSSVRSRMALNEAFNTRVASETAVTGRCTLIFDHKGHCLDQNCDPPAGTIP